MQSIMPEVREFLDQAPLGRESVEALAAMLPDNDAELDTWIAEAVRERDAIPFMLIVLAALSRERPVDARHLAGGAKLVGVWTYLAAIAFRVKGEMPEYLLEGIRNTALYNQIHAVALLSIAVWCDEHRGGVYPDLLIPEARIFARQTNHTAEVDVFLLELALRTRDSGLQSVIRKYYPKASDEDWEKVLDDCHSAAEKAIAESRRPILDLLPETPLEPINVSPTVRRAVPRTGRSGSCLGVLGTARIYRRYGGCLDFHNVGGGSCRAQRYWRPLDEASRAHRLYRGQAPVEPPAAHRTGRSREMHSVDRRSC